MATAPRVVMAVFFCSVILTAPLVAALLHSLSLPRSTASRRALFGRQTFRNASRRIMSRMAPSILSSIPQKRPVSRLTLYGTKKVRRALAKVARHQVEAVLGAVITISAINDRMTTAGVREGMPVAMRRLLVRSANPPSSSSHLLLSPLKMNASRQASSGTATSRSVSQRKSAPATTWSALSSMTRKIVVSRQALSGTATTRFVWAVHSSHPTTTP
mmetsp:Transcript_6077/g.10985  ORF Transcript_6077/g.10985 Transcript_6077/m.10985 type:complete len:216 (-) Transcript_6077:293-940(-)